MFSNSILTVSLLQNIKKEICPGPKGTFYNSFEMQQRRDISAEPYSTAVNIGNGAQPPPPQPPPLPSNNTAIHNYAPSNHLPPPPPSIKQTNAKNRFTNSAIQDGNYYGFYGKQPTNADYYGKYDAEFAAHHRKTPTVAATTASNQMPFNHQPKVEHFVEPKSDFHHIKTDFHSGHIKAELAHQKAMEFQHGKVANFHANQQSFYNHPSHNLASVVNGQNADGNHQVPIQYTSQYYPNEYAGVAPGEMDATAAAAYYDHKTSHPNYYENMYHGNSGEYNAIGNENPYGTAPAATPAVAPPSNGQLPSENCDNFMYPQYFEGNQNAHSNHQTHAQAQAHHPPPPLPSQQHQHHTGIHQTVHGTATATINISHGHNQIHQTAQQQSAQTVGGNFSTHNVVAPPYHHMQHTMNGLNGNQHIINMENSNSSSDFNFLSNLANDFAPEYYQLS